MKGNRDEDRFFAFFGFVGPAVIVLTCRSQRFFGLSLIFASSIEGLRCRALGCGFFPSFRFGYCYRCFTGRLSCSTPRLPTRSFIPWLERNTLLAEQNSHVPCVQPPWLENRSRRSIRRWPTARRRSIDKLQLISRLPTIPPYSSSPSTEPLPLFSIVMMPATQFDSEEKTKNKQTNERTSEPHFSFKHFPFLRSLWLSPVKFMIHN